MHAVPSLAPPGRPLDVPKYLQPLLCRFPLEVVIQYSTAEEGLDGTTRAGEGVDGDAVGAGGAEGTTDDAVGDDTGWVGADDCFSKTNFLHTWFSCFKAAFSDFNFSSC